MLNAILKYGLIAGLVVGGLMFAVTVPLHDKLGFGALGMAVGYASMLIALSAVFIGIKAHRDKDRGGVIGFWPALGLGLGISVVASICYALAWELVLAVTKMDFMGAYTEHLLADMRARGASATELAATTKEMADFAAMYANRWVRMGMSMAEILPVGVLVSAISAALLRRPQFLPARPAA
jgi:hypothetical protein